MRFQPSVDLPKYSTWTQEQLAVAAHNYHLQMLKMTALIEQLRLQLKEKEK